MIDHMLLHCIVNGQLGYPGFQAGDVMRSDRFWPICAYRHRQLWVGSGLPRPSKIDPLLPVAIVKKQPKADSHDRHPGEAERDSTPRFHYQPSSCPAFLTNV